MAGIGFELRKYLDEDSFTGTAKAYGFAGLISAGPWVLSILGVMLISVFALVNGFDDNDIRQFTTATTWIMGVSLILTGGLQLVFTRFIADTLFAKSIDQVNPNLSGALLLTTAVSLVIGVIVGLVAFQDSFLVELLLVANFVVLCNIWIAVIFVAGLKRFSIIIKAFALGYGVTFLASVALLSFGLPGLLTGLFLGHGLLLFLILGAVIADHPLDGSLSFDFLQARKIYPSLIVTGVCYNAGIWVDKFIFWLTPATSDAVLGPLRASLIYDLPIFLAYLSIIPGMAVFLLRIETDFAEAHEGFFEAVRGHATLQEIEELGDAMVHSVRQGLYQIVRVQGATVLALYLAGPSIVSWLGLSSAYVHLYYVNLVGVAAQVLMLAMLNVLFYLDRRRDAVVLTLTLFISNAGFTGLSVVIGPQWYGFGFGFSMVLSAAVGAWLLARELENIEFRTFMRPQVRVATTS